jgi:hypothetical protein
MLYRNTRAGYSANPTEYTQLLCGGINRLLCSVKGCGMCSCHRAMKGYQKVKSEAIVLTGRGGPQVCQVLGSTHVVQHQYSTLFLSLSPGCNLISTLCPQSYSCSCCS